MKKFLHQRKLIIAALLSVLFTALQVVGYQISAFYQTSVCQSAALRNIGILSPGKIVLFSLLSFCLWISVVSFLFTLLERTGSSSATPPQKIFFLWTVTGPLLFLCWLPCLLAGYPGFYTYDAMDQMPQALYVEVPYSAHHPLLHTLFMGKLITLGYHLGGSVSLNDGIALHSVVQMLLCAAAFSYIISYIYKITGKRWLCVAAFCYYGFFPVIALFSMCTTKDPLFSILLQLCVIFLYEICKTLQNAISPSRSLMLRFVVTAVLMCLFRKNGVYIIVCLIPFLLILWKKFRWKCLLLFCSVLFLFFIFSKGLLLTLNASKGSSEEALSVPMQQVARVYHEHREKAFEKEELSLIYSGISKEALSDYNPFLSDHIKNYFDYTAIQNKKKEFLSLWVSKGIQYPAEYIKSFLDNTYQAWYPGTSVFSSPDDTDTYYFSMRMCPGAERDTRAPRLLDFYTKIASSDSYYQKIPVIRLFFSIGAMFWVLLFTLGCAIYQKDKPLLSAMLMVLLYCGTVFLGPISLVRYYLVLFYGFPVTIAFLICSRKRSQ